MGGLFCSYLIDNKITRLRNAISNSQLSDIKSELKTDNSGSFQYFKNLLKKIDNPKGKGEDPNESTLLNAEIDSDGNTPIMFIFFFIFILFKSI